MLQLGNHLFAHFVTQSKARPLLLSPQKAYGKKVKYLGTDCSGVARAFPGGRVGESPNRGGGGGKMRKKMGKV